MVKYGRGIVNGCVCDITLESPVDQGTVQKLLELCKTPSGGVYVCHHVPTNPEGVDFYSQFIQQNPGMKAYVGYTTFETDRIPQPWVAACNRMDEIWVPSSFNVQTFASSGMHRSKLYVIPHGFDVRLYQPDKTTPLKINGEKGFTFLSIFEWTYRKGWDVLLKAYLEEFKRTDDVRLVIRAYQGGGVIGSRRTPIRDQIQELITSLDKDPDSTPELVLIEKIVPSELMPSLYKAADAFILPTRGEGWGIPFTESMLMEVPVIAPRWGGHLEFANDDNAFLIDIEGLVPVGDEQIRDNPFYLGHRWCEPSVEHTRKLMRYAYENRKEVKEKGKVARRYIESNYTIHHAAFKILERITTLNNSKKGQHFIPKMRVENVKVSEESPRILFMIRPDVFAQKKPFCEFLASLKKYLESKGCLVDYCTHDASVSSYDIVHIFGMDVALTTNAVFCGVPYVITPFLDLAHVNFNKTIAIARAFRNFASTEALERMIKKACSEKERESIDLAFILNSAQTVIASSKAEEHALRNLLKSDPPIETIIPNLEASECLDSDFLGVFKDKHKVEGFVLCHGRLEAKNNQLMLLYALKDTDLPLVFTGCEGSQPSYEELCRREGLNRKAETLFLNDLTAEEIASAYYLAAVCTKPAIWGSVLDLDLGLIKHGQKAVCSIFSPEKDYLDGIAHFFDPFNPQSIKESVFAALDSIRTSNFAVSTPSKPRDASLFDWKRILEIYKNSISRFKELRNSSSYHEKYKAFQQEVSYLAKKEKISCLTSHDLQNNLTELVSLRAFKPNDPYLNYSLGSICLKMNRFEVAEKYLVAAISVEPLIDFRAYFLLAIALSSQSRNSEAINVLIRSLYLFPLLETSERTLLYESIIGNLIQLGFRGALPGAVQSENVCFEPSLTFKAASDRPTPEEQFDSTMVPVVWNGLVFDPGGYADETRNLVCHVSKCWPIRLEPVGRKSESFARGLDASDRELLNRLMETPVKGPYIRLHHIPVYALQRDPYAAWNVCRTVFETDRLPAEWVEKLNSMDEIWVPTDFNVKTFQNSGVKTPLYVIPEAVDSDRFRPGLPPVSIPGRRQFVFLSIFEWIYRKGWDILLEAWSLAFSPEENVCLVLRTYPVNVVESSRSKYEILNRVQAFLENQLGRSLKDVAPIIILGNPLPQQHMPNLYAAADAFVLPSRGEGWGRPYIEAMASGLPVIGSGWGGNLAFMNEENSYLIDPGVLVDVDDRMEYPFYRGHKWCSPSVEHLAQLMRIVYEDRNSARRKGELARQSVQRDWTWDKAASVALGRLRAIAGELVKRKPIEGIDKQRIDQTESKPRPSTGKMKSIAVRWEGLQFVHHSMALINRELCLRLIDAGCELSIIKYIPEEFGPDADPRFPKIARRELAPLSRPADIHVRHHFSPDFTPPPEGRWVIIQPWEYGRLPEDWVGPMSRLVDEIWVPSRHVLKSYVASGVPADRVHVVPNGVNAEIFNPSPPPYPLATEKKFKFLFVGGTIWRKGVDILLKAYRHAFGRDDDVVLVIKEMGQDKFYRGQGFGETIANFSLDREAPEILYITDTLDEASMPGLYRACNCLVHPYRGEGFALPVLEAMACGLPVIVTKGGATDDFCSEETASLIPASVRGFTHTKERLAGGVGWVLEPDVESLTKLLRYAVSHERELQLKADLALERIKTFYTWDKVAETVLTRMERILERPIRRDSPVF